MLTLRFIMFLQDQKAANPNFTVVAKKEPQATDFKTTSGSSDKVGFIFFNSEPIDQEKTTKR